MREKAMSNFWINGGGENTLKGSDSNPLNTPILTDVMILEFLKIYPNARADFYQLLPSMLPEEQFRLETLIQEHPSVMKTEKYQQVQEDNFQSSMNKLRINSTTIGQLTGKTKSSDARSGLKVNIKPLIR
jgi:hypothetical protein